MNKCWIQKTILQPSIAFGNSIFEMMCTFFCCKAGHSVTWVMKCCGWGGEIPLLGFQRLHIQLHNLRLSAATAAWELVTGQVSATSKWRYTKRAWWKDLGGETCVKHCKTKIRNIPKQIPCWWCIFLSNSIVCQRRFYLVLSFTTVAFLWEVFDINARWLVRCSCNML